LFRQLLLDRAARRGPWCGQFRREVAEIRLSLSDPPEATFW